MGRCEGCSLNFPRLTGVICRKCTKLSEAKSEVERGVVEAQPQCASCSVVYPFLRVEFCGACRQLDLECDPDAPGIKFLFTQYQKTASEHQLTRKQNPQLQAATQMKDHMATLRKALKTEAFTTEITLFIYPSAGKAARKAQTLPVHKKWMGTDLAKEMFDFAKVELKKGYYSVAAAQQSKPITLNFEDVQFGIAHGKDVHNFVPSEKDLLGTIENLFECLKQEGKITPNDIKDHKNPAVERPIQVELAYDEYEFERTTFTTDTDGNLSEHVSLETETIKIARDWRRHIGDKPAGGYIAKGFMKFAFALEQVVESQNSIDLIAELRLLALGQYFANSFKSRVRVMGAVVETSICWNFEGAFIGKVTSGMLPHPADGEEDNRSLIYPIFLAAPLITTTGLYTERKFSGSDQAGNNNDEVGRVMDAYSHHVLVDSNGFLLLSDLQVGPDKEVILFDPQAHS
ncbi:hypothetical protein K443DRAFT_103331 [Laccaria amethystina LaAM-08-1]|uniref:Alpha-type protein kinase domain-containing protein n=1 Tax=Laccaria amethystina LaAM-08-1 TaxID=1095629 RepID=A0A0C9XS73_9AGAR|nr:hypothetical protein K443DRAFT_103331 [Laccaria amethystina LaAM-08-1]